MKTSLLYRTDRVVKNRLVYVVPVESWKTLLLYRTDLVLKNCLVYVVPVESWKTSLLYRTDRVLKNCLVYVVPVESWKSSLLCRISRVPNKFVLFLTPAESCSLLLRLTFYGVSVLFECLFTDPLTVLHMLFFVIYFLYPSERITKFNYGRWSIQFVYFLFLLSLSNCLWIVSITNNYSPLKSTIFWDITPCSHPIFRRNISPPFSGSNKPSKIPAWKQMVSRLGLCDPEDGDDTFLWNVGWFSVDYTALYLIR
jgi:hypothetical protein